MLNCLPVYSKDKDATILAIPALIPKLLVLEVDAAEEALEFAFLESS
jgi:hypothetical protein